MEKRYAHNPKVAGSSPAPATKGVEKCASGVSESMETVECNHESMIDHKIVPLVKLVTGDIKSRWHISFWYAHLGTNHRIRLYGEVNRIKNYEQRLTALQNLQLQVSNQLADGWNPVTNEYQKPKHLTIERALEQVIDIKRSYFMPTSFSAFSSRVNSFMYWLRINQFSLWPVAQIERKHITEYLNWLLVERSIQARTRNNHLADIKECFELLIENNNDEVKANPTKGIRKLPERSTRHEAYTMHEFTRISTLVKVINPYLHTYCKLIVYCGLRPVEICRLRVKDFDLFNRTITLPAKSEKNAERRILRIFDVLWPEIESMRLQDYPADYFVFNSQKEPKAKAGNRDWFTKQFAHVKKELRLPAHKTMYAIRHTFICDLLENGEDPLTVMKISGHKSWDAFKQYADKYLKKPVDDYTDKLTVVF